MSRQRNVFPTDEIPHLWAHRTQESARNSQGNLFFDGDTIYSYGRHFAIARHVMCLGEHGVLFTNRSYSNTTAKHIWGVRQSIPDGVPVFECHNPADDEETAAKELARAAREAVEALGKCRMKSQKAKAWRELLKADLAAAEIHRFIGKPWATVVPAEREELEGIAREYERQLEEKRAERSAKRSAKYARQHEEYERVRNMKLAEKTAAWRAGSELPLHIYGPIGCLLRVKGDQVETTMGAKVPLEHVVKVLPLVIALIKSGRTYQRNGSTIRLGHYMLDSIDEHGTVKAGCHTIERAEVERLAVTLGMLKEDEVEVKG